MLILSTSALKWYWLHKIFKIAKETSFEWINLDLVQWDFDAEDTSYVKELSETFQVPVVSITSYERKMDSKTVRDVLYMWKELWAKTLNFYPPHRLDKDTTWFSQELPKVKKENPEFFISVINVEPKTFLFFIPEYKDATLSTIKKITWDTTLSIWNVDPSSWIDLMKTFSLLWNSIRNVFLTDKTWSKQDLFLWKWDMPLRDLLWRLHESSYNWLFTIKISPKELSAWKDDVLLQKLSDAKAYFEKYFK